MAAIAKSVCLPDDEIMSPPVGRQCLQVAAAVDGRDVFHRPAAVLVEQGRILTVGSPKDFNINQGNAQPVDLSNYLLMPALVNAHAHLDLTLLGSQSYPGNFVQWFNYILVGWPVLLQTHNNDEESLIRAAILAGSQLSKQAGVGYVGDISDHPCAWAALAEAAMTGVSFLEVVGLTGQRLEGSLAALSELEKRLTDMSRSRLVQGKGELLPKAGVQPHAPYSTGQWLYRASVELADKYSLPVCTHLAETTEELEFVAQAEGAFQKLLQKMGRWRNDLASDYQHGLHPVDWLLPRLARRNKPGWLLAHCNYVQDDHLRILAAHGCSVAYCPIASEYFGHRNHRYRDMMTAGVNVCLGTDSILCQPTHESQPLGMLPVMRRLYRRDGLTPQLLLQMATVNGLRALGLPESFGWLAPGSPARFTLVPMNPSDPVDPLTQIMKSEHPARLWE